MPHTSCTIEKVPSARPLAKRVAKIRNYKNESLARCINVFLKKKIGKAFAFEVFYMPTSFSSI